MRETQTTTTVWRRMGRLIQQKQTVQLLVIFAMQWVSFERPHFQLLLLDPLLTLKQRSWRYKTDYFSKKFFTILILHCLFYIFISQLDRAPVYLWLPSTIIVCIYLQLPSMNLQDISFCTLGYVTLYLRPRRIIPMMALQCNFLGSGSSIFNVALGECLPWMMRLLVCGNHSHA